MRLFFVGLVLAGSMELAQASSLKLLRSSWARGVATVGTLAVLALPLPYVHAAPDKQRIAEKMFVDKYSPAGEWRTVFAGSYAPFLSVLNLQSEFTDDRRLSTEHLLYLGQSRDDNSAVFLTMRDVAVDYLHHDGKMQKRGNSYTLWSWNNLLQDEIAIEPFQSFTLPQLDYYDFVLLKVAGLDLRDDFVPVQLAAFPSYAGTPITHLSYMRNDQLVDFPQDGKKGERDDFNNDPNNDEDIQDRPAANDEVAAKKEALPLANDIDTRIPPPELSSSLQWRRCQASALHQATQIGTFDCSPYRDILQGSVVFNAATGAAVGFYFYRFEGEGEKIVHKSSVATFSPHLLNYVEENFTVSPRGKLSTSWGALKKD